jgi:hypothetical protein
MTSHGRAARLRVARDVALTTPASLVAALSRIQLGSVFNPYADRCPEHDRHDAARIRRRNLVRYLEGALDVRVETMWIARDLGYRSGRRTGIPITDEFHLEQAGAMIGGAHLGRATLGPPVAERTSTAVWVVLARIGEPTLLWNAFPPAPARGGQAALQPLSYRCGAGGHVAAHVRADRYGAAEEDRGDREGRRRCARRGRCAGARGAAPEPRWADRVSRGYVPHLHERRALILILRCRGSSAHSLTLLTETLDANSINERSQCRGQLPASWVIEVEPEKRRAPIR